MFLIVAYSLHHPSAEESTNQEIMKKAISLKNNLIRF